MTRDEVINAVKVVLEEYSPYDEPSSFVVDTDNVKPIHSYINEMLDDAANDMLRILPLHLINGIHKRDMITPTRDLTIDSEHIGIIPLPDDFLRLHTIKLGDWARTVTKANFQDEPIYRLQRNRYTRGKSDKPVVIVSEDHMELYSALGEQPTVEEFTYVPKISETPQGYLEDPLEKFVAYRCGIKVLELFEQFDKVKVLNEELQSMIQMNYV